MLRLQSVGDQLEAKGIVRKSILPLTPSIRLSRMLVLEAGAADRRKRIGDVGASIGRRYGGALAATRVGGYRGFA